MSVICDVWRNVHDYASKDELFVSLHLQRNRILKPTWYNIRHVIRSRDRSSFCKNLVLDSETRWFRGARLESLCHRPCDDNRFVSSQADSWKTAWDWLVGLCSRFSNWYRRNVLCLSRFSSGGSNDGTTRYTDGGYLLAQKSKVNMGRNSLSCPLPW